MRSEFVANVSHELKTPLASIIGAVETLKTGAVDDLENRGVFLGMIEHHSAELKQLIDDLLDLSRIESGNLAAQRDAFRVKDLFEDLNKTFSHKAAEKKIELRFNAPGDAEVRADRPRIRQALQNLIENALNYTDTGGKVAVEGSRNGGGTTFAVTDSGIGIAPLDQPRIFERFYRAEKSRSRHAGGTGLGLAIVKHIAESHGGRVEVQSELQKGSSFRLILPN
jgi:two-component system phosphate regulon sensor histidine kinase PhoR